VGVASLGILIQGILESFWVGLVPLILFAALREALSAVTGEILRPVFFEGIILAAIGLSMVLTSLLISYRNSRRI
jgi:hypothetical protein